mmetsp:Transcript_25251/g.46927  ORF Transcript_25251/g.46927 Transcript_25251/m.46927 type:complete len:265 (+) Transcript_25251:515-1309(+)
MARSLASPAVASSAVSIIVVVAVFVSLPAVTLLPVTASAKAASAQALDTVSFPLLEWLTTCGPSTLAVFISCSLTHMRPRRRRRLASSWSCSMPGGKEGGTIELTDAPPEPEGLEESGESRTVGVVAFSSFSPEAGCASSSEVEALDTLTEAGAAPAASACAAAGLTEDSLGDTAEESERIWGSSALSSAPDSFLAKVASGGLEGLVAPLATGGTTASPRSIRSLGVPLPSAPPEAATSRSSSRTSSANCSSRVASIHHPGRSR